MRIVSDHKLGSYESLGLDVKKKAPRKTHIVTCYIHENDNIDVYHLNKTYSLNIIKSIKKVSKFHLFTPSSMYVYWETSQRINTKILQEHETSDDFILSFF